MEQIIAAAVTLVVFAVAAFGLRAAGKSPSKVTELMAFAESVALALEEAYPGAAATGKEKLEYALERMMTKYGVDREEAAVYVNAAVAGLRQAGIKPPRDVEPNAEVAKAASGVEVIFDAAKGLRNSLSTDDPALD